MFFSFFCRLQSATQTHMYKIHKHPFNLALEQGSLPLQSFREFLEQDKLYLQDFSRALDCVAQRMENIQQRDIIQNIADDILKAEINFHHKYLRHYPSPNFFQPQLKNPTVASYTQFLLCNAQSVSIHVAIASLVPCFYIYSQLGLHMQIQSPNPFQSWLASYTNPRFLNTTQEIIRLTNDLAKDVNSEAQEQMITAFIKSTEFEIKFWDSINIEHRIPKNPPCPSSNDLTVKTNACPSFRV